jgi:hypothetical protein
MILTTKIVLIAVEVSENHLEKEPPDSTPSQKNPEMWPKL